MNLAPMEFMSFGSKRGTMFYKKLANTIEKRLEKEEARLKDEIARATGMLGNERFVSKAPEEKIAQERAKVEKYTQMLEQVTARLKQLRQGKKEVLSDMLKKTEQNTQQPESLHTYVRVESDGSAAWLYLETRDKGK